MSTSPESASATVRGSKAQPEQLPAALLTMVSAWRIPKHPEAQHMTDRQRFHVFISQVVAVRQQVMQDSALTAVLRRGRGTCLRRVTALLWFLMSKGRREALKA